MLIFDTLRYGRMLGTYVLFDAHHILERVIKTYARTRADAHTRAHTIRMFFFIYLDYTYSYL